MSINKFFTIIVFSIMLLGCNVGSRVQGVWYGVATDTQGSSTEAVMFINEKGEIFISLRNGVSLTADGYYQNENEVTNLYGRGVSNFQSLDLVNINKEVNIELTGQLGAQEGSVELLVDKEKLYALSLSSSSEEPIAEQKQFTGTWPMPVS